jgi:ligand-binding sensor domain-containing protein
MSDSGLTERALRARSSLEAASGATPIPVFRPRRQPRPALRWAAPAMAALAAVVIATGAIVIADRTPNRVVSQDAVTSVAAGQLPVDVATDGTLVWIADGGTGRVLALDAHTLRQRWSVRVGTRPVALAYGGGALWAVDRAGARLLRLDPRTGRVTGTGRTSLEPVAVDVAAGSVWVLSAGNQTLDRYDLTTMKQVASAVLGAAGGAVTHTGSTLWVAIPGGLSRVEAVNRASLPVTTIALTGNPVALAADDRNRLWVALDNKTLVTADGRTGRITGRVALSAAATAVASGGSAVIVGTDDGRLLRYVATGTTGAHLGSTGATADALAVSGRLVVGISRNAAVLFATETSP